MPNVYSVSLGSVNAFLIDTDGLTLIDTGTEGSADAILDAIREIGRRPEDLDCILVTHCHADHAGSLAELKRATGVEAHMHPLDAAMVREGKALRPLQPSPGLAKWLIFQIFIRPASATIQPAKIEHEVNDGDEIPVAGRMRAIHTPGHCAGQLSFLWPQEGGVLFAADACSNIPRLGLALGYEDLEEGRRSLRKLAQLDFEVACFGHGGAITRGASRRFRKKWHT